MKKLVLLFAVCLCMVGCEKEVIGEGFPEMEGFYVESCGLSAVSLDSVKSFSVKVDDFTLEFSRVKGTLTIPEDPREHQDRFTEVDNHL